MGIMDEGAITIQPLPPGWYGGKVAGIDMLRLDRLHPIVSGNKWYKLRLNIEAAIAQGRKAIVTFGGGFSNHLIAAAYAARQYGLASVGVVRGHYPSLTPTLAACRDAGMQLIFITKEEYKKGDSAAWAGALGCGTDEVYIIPEGGANEAGRAGAGLIAGLIDGGYTHVAVPVGTGTTFVGLRNALPAQQVVMGFAPMKQGRYLEADIIKHLHPDKNTNWHLYERWHFGGFGRRNDVLIRFMNSFYTHTGIPLDVVYTAKMMYGIVELIGEGAFTATDRLLCVHTGGLQGNATVQAHLVQ